MNGVNPVVPNAASAVPAPKKRTRETATSYPFTCTITRLSRAFGFELRAVNGLLEDLDWSGRKCSHRPRFQAGLPIDLSAECGREGSR